MRYPLLHTHRTVDSEEIQNERTVGGLYQSTLYACLKPSKRKRIGNPFTIDRKAFEIWTISKTKVPKLGGENVEPLTQYLITIRECNKIFQNLETPVVNENQREKKARRNGWKVKWSNCDTPGDSSGYRINREMFPLTHR